MAREMYDKVKKEWVSEDEYYRRKSMRRVAPQRSDLPIPHVFGDIEPYESVITGEMITSRSKHREHLSQHGCVEVGNERLPPPGPPTTEQINNATKQRVDDIKSAARENGVDVI